ncbi:MAG: hypothetical protein KJ709_01320 [Nanoarchaeota archaeon]|nr:hypothetical protein [Nanoarchaeota archaeon]
MGDLIPVSLGKIVERTAQFLADHGVTHTDEENPLVGILDDLEPIDPEEIGQIAMVVQYMSEHNAFVREQIKAMPYDDRHNRIEDNFKSIIDDLKIVEGQYADDNRISTFERWHNRIRHAIKGTTHERFEDIRNLYLEIAADTRERLQHQAVVLGNYSQYRKALKMAEGKAHGVKKTQKGNYDAAVNAMGLAAQTLADYKGDDGEERSRLEGIRDDAITKKNEEVLRYDRIKRIAEFMTVGYNLGDMLMVKLTEKKALEQLNYDSSVTLFQTHEGVFTALDLLLTVDQGMREQLGGKEELIKGTESAIDYVMNQSFDLDVAVATAGYGDGMDRKVAEKLKQHLVEYLTKMEQVKEDNRKISTETAETYDRVWSQQGVNQIIQIRAGLPPGTLDQKTSE